MRLNTRLGCFKGIVLLLMLLFGANILEAKHENVILDGVKYSYYTGQNEDHTAYAYGLIDGFTGHANIRSAISGTDDEGNPITRTVYVVDGFSDCFGLTGVSFPNSVILIDGFSGCTGLTSIYIPSSVVDLGDFNHDGHYYPPFVGCTNLSRITVDGANTKFDSRDNCNAVIMSDKNMLIIGCDSTLIPESVVSIACGAFDGKGIKKIHIPESLTEIGLYQENPWGPGSWFNYMYPRNAFTNCKQLFEITVDPNNPIFDSRDNCNAIIETSSNTLLIGCNGTVIPNTVECIERAAFYGSNIESIVIPSSVTRIYETAFNNCNNMTSITCKGTIPPYGTNISENESFYERVTLYVPKSAIETYRNDFEWGKFVNIVGIGGSASICDVNGDGEVNIADINAIIHIIVTSSYNLINYDVNGDGETNIGDVNVILDVIFYR